jgi:CubicO group peptidase (beta-lactamase class C family)
MSDKQRSSGGKSIRKSVRFVLFLVLAIFIAGNLFIVLSGRFYLYKGLAYTYFSGRTGPSIYELDYFPHTKIAKSDNPENWKLSADYNTQKIPADYRKWMEDLGTKAFLVFKGDEIVFESYWDGHTSETVSNSFSAAKTVVALLIGIAQEEGFIKNLDEKVGVYIPEFNSDGKEELSIRHLLMMSAGLDWEESGKNPLSENAESYYGTGLYNLVTSQKMIEKPGVRFNYQSGNSQLLGYIVEKATGRGLSEYAQEKIWKKIGASHDAYWSLDRKKGDEKAFCCLYSTARDFGLLGKLIKQKGQWKENSIIPKEYMEEMFKNPVLKTDEGVPNLRYGLHIWTYLGHSSPVYYCRGILGQYVISIPGEDLVIVRLGDARMKEYEIPNYKMNDIEYVKKKESYVGHPMDLMKYISLGEILLEN